MKVMFPNGFERLSKPPNRRMPGRSGIL